MGKSLKTRFYFFSGKGGVGKTTMACASAIYLAALGEKTLIITTDPASNLADVFEQNIGNEITTINTTTNLFALELDPDKATEEYKQRTIAPLQGIVPPESLEVIEEQLNSPCTAEVAAFERFTDFLQDPEFDTVIFDTAPTGHTLRLIQLPVEWSGVIEEAARSGTGGQTCVGPAASLAESKLKFDRAIEAMRNPDEATFIFVLRPEATSIYETNNSITELSKLGIRSQELIVNGIYPQNICDSPFMKGRYSRQQQFLQTIKDDFSLPTTLVELKPSEVKGVAALYEVAEAIFKKPMSMDNYSPIILENIQVTSIQNYPSTDLAINQLLTPINGRRTIFFAGKGGVGKTSVAAATSLWIAKQGYRTILITTDPASHLAQVFEQNISDKPTLIEGEQHLWISHIDPSKAAQQYKEKVLAEIQQKYDEKRVLAVEEELNSPCTEEMATFEKFIEFATLKDYEVMIFDTAPTGHTLRLLNLPVEWNRQLEIKIFTTVESNADKITKSRFLEVINMMQDPEQTTFSFVMYPEKTPIEEASRAMSELSEIDIKTSLVVANMILPNTIITNDYWRQRQAMQKEYLKEMKNRFKAPIIQLPLLDEDLMGKDKLVQAGMLLYGIKNPVAEGVKK
ncbi:MAG: TRC40/GET3/ArsA family transport-energizing ATPase [Dehalococcoidia bacterium]|nr:MAG: TRC40/GET3/ArsA family transport-energizing ATPase [Dehalococcoidia bacterium]